MSSGAVNPNSPGVQDWLREGIAAAKAGQRERARDVLMRVVEQDEDNLAAWLWLSGVVDSLDDKEVCLENVLELDPGNDAARKGLAWVRQQKGTQPPSPRPAPTSPPPAGPSTPRRAASTAAAMLSGEFEQRYSIPKSELAPASVANEFDNEYLCPYCAAPTRREDGNCRSCGGSLWVKIHRKEKTSCLFRGVLALQIFSAVEYGAALLAMIALVASPPAAGNPTAAGASLSSLPPGTAAMLPVMIAVYALICLYSVVVAVGLFMRWMVILYLYIANALLTLGLAIPTLFITASQGAGIICGASIMLIALAQIGIIFALEEDFAYDKRRILLRPDVGAIGAIALLDSGRRYVKRGMWALAAIHLQRAVQMMPGELDYHLLLAGVYINLKRYPLADKILAQARRISPYDPQVERLAAIVAKHGGG